MMRRLFSSIVLILSVAFAGFSVASAAFISFATNSGTTPPAVTWSALPIGAGGQLTHLDIQCDTTCSPGVGTVTKVVATDTYGAWYYNPAVTCGNNSHVGCWQQLVTAASMPVGAQVFLGGQAVYEIRIAPSNTSHFYMYYSGDGCIYSSTNKGTTWTKTAFICVNASGGASRTKFSGPFISVDPGDENRLFVGTPLAGIWKSTDGNTFTSLTNILPTIQTATTTSTTSNTIGTGSKTFAIADCAILLNMSATYVQVYETGNTANIIYGSLTSCTSGSLVINSIVSWGTGTHTDWSIVGDDGGTVGHVLAYDPASATTLGAKQGIYAGVYGVGIYHSTDAGATWTLTTGTQTTFTQIEVDATGVLWMTTNDNGGGPAGRVYRYLSGTWSQMTGAGTVNRRSPTFDSNNCSTSATCRVVIGGDDGNVNITTDGGATWNTTIVQNITRSAADIPWLQNTPEASLTNGKMKFDPSRSNVMGFAQGIGYWEVNPSNTGANLTITSVSAAIEQLLPFDITVPPSGTPVVTFWDRPVFKSPGPTTYPTDHGVDYTNSIVRGTSVDFAKNLSSTLVVVADWLSAAETSGYSTDGGAHWTKFTSYPTDVIPNPGTGIMHLLGGSIAACTNTNFVWAVSNNGSLFSTTNGGTTWTRRVPAGVPPTDMQITNGTTTSGTAVLNFASVPATVVAGQGITDWTNNQSLGTVLSKTSTTVTASVNAGTTINSGAFIIFISPETGWGYVANLRHKMLAADYVTANLIYAYNYGPNGVSSAAGIYRSTDCGATWTHALTGALQNSGSNITFATVPGNAGNMYFTGGSQSGGHPTSQIFYECQDTAGTVTCNAVANMTDVWAFAIGKAKSGGYPTLYVYGAYNGTTMGFWQSTDHAASWTQVGSAFQDTLDSVAIMGASQDTYGLFYACYTGGGCRTGQVNWLLKRDLDPASNDNTPVGLNMAA